MGPVGLREGRMAMAVMFATPAAAFRQGMQLEGQCTGDRETWALALDSGWVRAARGLRELAKQEAARLGVSYWEDC